VYIRTLTRPRSTLHTKSNIVESVLPPPTTHQRTAVNCERRWIIRVINNAHPIHDGDDGDEGRDATRARAAHANRPAVASAGRVRCASRGGARLITAVPPNVSRHPRASISVVHSGTPVPAVSQPANVLLLLLSHRHVVIGPFACYSAT